jgi:arginine/ornithine transport system substrate-binding protein
MKVKCEWVTQDWDGIIPALQAGKFDAIIASMSITEERKKKVDFTGKYYFTPARFVAKKGSGLQITKEGLKGKRVGVQRATIHDKFLTDNFGDTVEVVRYGTQDEANTDLINGRLDAILADSVALKFGLLDKPEGKDFAFVGPPETDPRWFGPGAGIAVRKEDTDLRDKLNAAINAIRADGTWERIKQKYFGDMDIWGTPAS